MTIGVRVLANWEARMMREYRAGGWTQAELAFFFGISQGRVSKVLRGQSYKDAGGPIETSRRYERRH